MNEFLFEMGRSKLFRRLAVGAGLGAVLILILFLIVNGIQEREMLSNDARQSAPGKFIALSDGTTHYLEMGAEHDIPLVLVHGGGVTGFEVWARNADFLSSKGYRVLLYDLYGRGYSDRPEVTYTPELLSRQLTELLDSLNFPDSISMVSMSLGSMVALDYSHQNPNSVQSLVMIAPILTGDYRPNSLLRIPGLSDLLMTFYWYPKAIENQRKEFVDQALFDQYAKRLEYFMHFRGYKHVNYSTWMNTLNQNRLEQLVTRPPHSTLLIYGKNDPYFSAQTAQKLTDKDSTIRVQPVVNAGHLPHYEKPGEVNPLILDFLNGSRPK